MPKVKKRTAPLGRLEPFRVAMCRGCGCTDNQACPEGCWWVERDLCSSCAAMEPGPGEWLVTFMTETADGDDLKVRSLLAFMPVAGMLVAPHPLADYLRVDEVYWRASEPRSLDVFLVHPVDLPSSKELLAQGWIDADLQAGAPDPDVAKAAP